MIKLVKKSNGKIMTDISITQINWREFACGWGAAFVNITVTYPINKIIFRQMLYGVTASSALSQLRNEGFYFLYRGMLPPLCQKTFSMSLMFGIYEEIRCPLVQVGINEYTAKAIGALISGTTEVTLMPFERIQTLLADSTYHNQFKNTLDAFKKVGMHYGFKEYYRGLVPILFRNGPSNVGFFIIRDEIQLRMPKFDSKVRRTISEFFCGALIGAVLSSIFYPLNVIKIAMQTQLGGNFQNSVKVLMQIYIERGRRVSHIYHGVITNCTRAFISWGVMNTAYENLKKIMY